MDSEEALHRLWPPAPQRPRHVHQEDSPSFDAGSDSLREERLARLTQAGIIDRNWMLTDEDPPQPPLKHNAAWRPVRKPCASRLYRSSAVLLN